MSARCLDPSVHNSCQRAKGHDGGHCTYDIDDEMAAHIAASNPPSAPTPGSTTGGDWVACENCDGIGSVNGPVEIGDMAGFVTAKTCPRCGGTGTNDTLSRLEAAMKADRLLAFVCDLEGQISEARADLAAALKREAESKAGAAEATERWLRAETERDHALKREGEARAETAETAETARALADALIDEDKALRERDTAQRAARKARERATRLERIIYDSDGILEARNRLEALAPVPTAEAKETT